MLRTDVAVYFHCSRGGGCGTLGSVEAFQWTYRGSSRAYVDMFPEPNHRANWVGQLGIYLHDEIEPAFW
jgi:hypothetical protein